MYRLLLIDDEESVRTAVTRRLKREGFVVTEAENAAEGIAKIQEAEPAFDLVITDMSMEDPDAGLRVLNAAVARDLFSEVIIMTAFANVENAVECMRRGAFDYIEKNKPGEDVYELLTLKVLQAMDRRRQDTRNVDRWARAAKIQEERNK